MDANPVQDHKNMDSAPSETPAVRSKAAQVVRVAAKSKDEPDSDEEPAEDDVEDAQDDEEIDLLEDYPDETYELELIHSRIANLAPLRLSRFAPYLQKLCLRQNQISHLEPDVFHTLTNLDELDFYDNKIKHVGRALDKLDKLTVLDLSFNNIRTVPDALQHLPALRTVYFVQNRISKISGLENLTNLTSLELGGNRIRKIEQIDDLVNLKELWLGKNKISRLENLDKLKKLRILSIQSNRITKLEGLDELENLEELYISHNGILKIEGLDKNLKITTVDIGNNFIKELENLSHLQSLEELWMSNNEIPDLRGLEPQLRHIESLNTLYLEGNPCQKTDMANYRRKIQLALPQLKQIDATFTRAGGL
ncbi:hypothetical protein BD626DRAFT_507575 [Schizophyllum amplum]|uniref:Protein phosphatase 1 regulatory subunit 7 n=1 Tax=Schizophyllum amplum TaxID=97359 RepID=A0A550C461_9AGAR|nr:hypothetical protein BD626DRAFT_507575 [Auriculariopsis ampla]